MSSDLTRNECHCWQSVDGKLTILGASSIAFPDAKQGPWWVLTQVIVLQQVLGDRYVRDIEEVEKKSRLISDLRFMTECCQHRSHFFRAVLKGRSRVEFDAGPCSHIGRLCEGWTQMSMPLPTVLHVDHGGRRFEALHN